MEHLLSMSSSDYNFGKEDRGIILLDGHRIQSERVITVFTGYFKFTGRNSVFMRFDKKLVLHYKIFYDPYGNIEKITKEYDRMWFFDIYKYYFHNNRVIHFLKGEEDMFCLIEKSESICVLEPSANFGPVKTFECINLIINRDESDVTLYTDSIYNLDIRPFTKLYMEKILGLV